MHGGHAEVIHEHPYPRAQWTIRPRAYVVTTPAAPVPAPAPAPTPAPAPACITTTTTATTATATYHTTNSIISNSIVASNCTLNTTTHTRVARLIGVARKWIWI